MSKVGRHALQRSSVLLKEIHGELAITELTKLEKKEINIQKHQTLYVQLLHTTLKT
jgi:hypothetical protein